MRTRPLLVVTIAVLLASTVSVLVLVRINAPLPAPQVNVVPTTLRLASGTPETIPLPHRGAFAVMDSRAGKLADHDGQTVRPIASMAKAMTALVVLDAMPLQPGEDGPRLTVTADDVALTNQIVAEGGTYAPIKLGEILTERELLLGLMLPSANNFAVMLGRWVAGSDGAFVSRLNAKAVALKMASTHFADADGLSSATVSTPDDLLLLGQADLTSPTLLSITTQAQATLPDGSLIHNIDKLVGTEPGWLGIKTGDTSAAGYCLLFASQRQLAPGTTPVTVWGVVMAQTTRSDTFTTATTAVDAALAAYIAVDVAQLHPSLSGQLTTAWNSVTGLALANVQPQTILVRKGDSIELTPTTLAVAAAPPQGTVVAYLAADAKHSYQLGITGAISWPIQTTESIPTPSWWWRLWHA